MLFSLNGWAFSFKYVIKGADYKTFRLRRKRGDDARILKNSQAERPRSHVFCTWLPGEMAMSEFVNEVTDQNFESEVLNASNPVLVDFWASWCAPCRMLAPVVETIAEQYHNRVKVLKLNIDDNIATAGKYSIRSIPTLLLFKEGEVKEQIVGNTSPGTITKMLDNHLGA